MHVRDLNDGPWFTPSTPPANPVVAGTPKMENRFFGNYFRLIMVRATIVELTVDLSPFPKGDSIWIGAKWGSPRQLLIVLWVEFLAAIAGWEIIGIESIMGPGVGRFSCWVLLFLFLLLFFFFSVEKVIRRSFFLKSSVFFDVLIFPLFQFFRLFVCFFCKLEFGIVIKDPSLHGGSGSTSLEIVGCLSEKPRSLAWDLSSLPLFSFVSFLCRTLGLGSRFAPFCRAANSLLVSWREEQILL